MSGLPLITDPNLIIGIERSDDAGVYKLNDNLAIIQTVDFLTPIVDDPYIFGQIAAANSISDVYAKGGKPLTAMNIVCFPIQTLDITILREILRGGLDKMHEAGVILIGGHSVDDIELKYGLSVTGTIDPQKVVRNTGAKPGDKIILTKPLGTGIINTALKGGIASREAIEKSIKCMTTLNDKTSSLMMENDIHACTDITGFGLLGHASEMIAGTDTGLIIHYTNVPVISEAIYYADMGLLPGGLQRNRDYRKSMIQIESEVPESIYDILFDPQTSGGLLISLPSKKANSLLKKMHKSGIADAAIIGEITDSPKGKIIIRD